ncbi:hypothetical protein SS50377_21379 [Spironucleus salmonicida]|uniref:Uncharacterized protein n=1 Tax=Spironucleus salmonicida TaxID=348837 RepID=A0A9P8LWY0_9EUKA|nr:hypothetical protein SS50377_21379 [Spironucleus salmonicida]
MYPITFHISLAPFNATEIQILHNLKIILQSCFIIIKKFISKCIQATAGREKYELVCDCVSTVCNMKIIQWYELSNSIWRFMYLNHFSYQQVKLQYQENPDVAINAMQIN